jgi:hypothetical protein
LTATLAAVSGNSSSTTALVTQAYLGATATGLHAQLHLFTTLFSVFPSFNAIAAALVPKRRHG